MTAKLISCIVPAYNAERYLGETIENILAQTYQPLEVIVVDDGSTDATAGVIDGFGDAVRKLTQSNRGHAAARNLGIQHARGTLIAFQDADDLWHAEKLERQFDLLQRHPDAGGCVAHVRNFWEDHTQEAADTRQARRSQGVVGFTIACLLAHRWAFERVGRFDVDLSHCDDADWFLRARVAGVAIEVVAEVLCFRRMHGTNRSVVHADSSLDEYLRLLKRHLDRQRSEDG